MQYCARDLMFNVFAEKQKSKYLFSNHVSIGSRTIAPEENCPPTLKLTLTLTPTRG